MVEIEFAIALNAGFLLFGVGVGTALTPGIIAHFVRKHGDLTFRWGKRWYRVKGLR